MFFICGPSFGIQATKKSQTICCSKPRALKSTCYCYECIFRFCCNCWYKCSSGTCSTAQVAAKHTWWPGDAFFLFHHGKAIGSSSSGTFMRVFKGPIGSSSDEWRFPRALAFATSGIRSSTIVSITCDEEIITGYMSFEYVASWLPNTTFCRMRHGCLKSMSRTYGD